MITPESQWRGLYSVILLIQVTNQHFGFLLLSTERRTAGSCTHEQTWRGSGLHWQVQSSFKWSSQRGCNTAVLLASLEQCQSASAEELNQDVYPTIPTFLGSRKQDWEFWKNRFPALCVARWTTKQALSDWLVHSPGQPATSPGAWKDWGRIAGKESILQKLRNTCGRFFSVYMKVSMNWLTSLLLGTSVQAVWHLYLPPCLANWNTVFCAGMMGKHIQTCQSVWFIRQLSTSVAKFESRRDNNKRRGKVCDQNSLFNSILKRLSSSSDWA